MEALGADPPGVFPKAMRGAGLGAVADLREPRLLGLHLPEDGRLAPLGGGTSGLSGERGGGNGAAAREAAAMPRGVPPAR